MEPDHDAGRCIGEEDIGSVFVCSHLRQDREEAEGLAVTWNGETTSRIEVAIGDWRKPLPA